MKKYFLLSLVATFFVLGGFSSAHAQTCPDGSNPQYSFDVNTGNSTYTCPATTKTGASVTTVAGQSTGNGQAPVTTTQAPTPAAQVTNTNCPSGGTLNKQTGSCDLGYTPLEPIPGVTSGIDLTSSAGFSSLVNAIFRVLISVGALLAVLMLTIGGVQYMTSSSIGNKTQGLDRAKAAIYGMILIAATWLILNTINPQLLNFNFIACAGGNCQGQSSINTFTQTSGFTNPNLPAPTTANTATHTTSSPSACSAGGGFPMGTNTNGTTECASMPL